MYTIGLQYSLHVLSVVLRYKQGYRLFHYGFVLICCVTCDCVHTLINN